MSRVTFTQINTVVQGNLQANYGKLAKLQEGLSSGKRLTRPSDSPIDTTNDLELRSDLGSMNQFQRNTDDSASYLAVVDSTLITLNNAYQNVRERAIQGASDTMSGLERSYIAEDVRQSGLMEMLTIANTTYKGDYVFSGHRTDIPPYQLIQGTESIDAVDNSATDPTDTALTAVPSTIRIWDRNVTDSQTTSGNAAIERMIPGTLTIAGLDEETDYTVDYQEGYITFLTPAATTMAATTGIDMDFEWIRKTEENINGEVLRQIDKGITVGINVNANDVFGDNNEKDSFKMVIGMLEGLYSDRGDMVGDSITEMDTALSRSLSSGSIIGSLFNRVELADDRLSDKIIETTRIQSELEDLDFAKAISDFTLQEAVYNASLQSASRVLQASLMDFL
jgi:flagellar hook-associated protein 3 FlgL